MREADYLENQLTLFDKCECPRGEDNHDSLFGKTYQVHLQADQSVVLTLEPCLKASQKPIFQCLKMEDGRQPEWFNAQSVKLHGEFLTLNFGEFPNEERESSLSQILQQPTDVPEKYYLSAKAVIGILKRAQKRNKELPFALKEALIQQSGMRGDYYGEKEITYAGEILRSVWSEAGTEAFVEWVRRTALLVQQKKILFADMQYDSAEEEKIKCASYESKNQQTESEGDCAGSSMCGLWEDWLYRGSSCGLKSHEQLVRKLGEVMQKLSCQKTPYALFMRCLWIASEGTSSMWQALASVEEIEFERLGHAIHEENKRDFERKCEINTPLLFDVRISSDGTHNWRAHCYETERSRSLDTHAPYPATNQGGVAILEDVNLEHQNAQVVFSFDSLSSNSMKSSNPNSGCRQVEVAKTLDTSTQDPSKNQGGVAILEDVNLSTVGGQNEITIYDMTHAQDVIRENKQAPTLNARMGTGDNQVPILLSAGFKGEQSASARGLGYKEEQCPTLTTANPPCALFSQPITKVYDVNAAKELDRTNTLDTSCRGVWGKQNGTVAYCIAGNMVDRETHQLGSDRLERRTCTCNGKQTVGSLCAHDGRGFNGQDAANDKLIIEHYETNNDS